MMAVDLDVYFSFTLVLTNLNKCEDHISADH